MCSGHFTPFMSPQSYTLRLKVNMRVYRLTSLFLVIMCDPFCSTSLFACELELLLHFGEEVDSVVFLHIYGSQYASNHITCFDCALPSAMTVGCVAGAVLDFLTYCPIW